MSSDPSPHLPAPVPPPGAAEVDPQSQSQPPAPPAEPPEVMHRTRAVDFLGRRTPIVYQNDNGPCPLLAICELSFRHSIPNPRPPDVTAPCVALASGIDARGFRFCR